MPENHYLLTEIKNDELERTEIHQNEAEQMSNSANWFEKEYGKGVPVTLLMVHPAEHPADSAYPPAKAMVMTLAKLEELHARLCAFAAALSSKSPEAWTANEIGTLLASHRLDAGSIRTNYCVPAKRLAASPIYVGSPQPLARLRREHRPGPRAGAGRHRSGDCRPSGGIVTTGRQAVPEERSQSACAVPGVLLGRQISRRVGQCSRLGDVTQSRRFLDEAKNWLETTTLGHANQRALPNNIDDADWVEFRVLYREAIQSLHIVEAWNPSGQKGFNNL